MSTEQATKKKFKKRYYLYILLLILIGVRIWLPYYVKNTLVKSINAVEGYSCTIEDVDLALYRGGMVIENLEIFITDNDVQVPYVILKEMDIAVELRAILDGEIVAQILLTEPSISFFDSEEEEEKQVGDVSWVDPILDFIPLRINKFEIKDGSVKFENIGSTPPVALEMTKINATATNLTNSKDLLHPLPSDVKFTSHIMKSGKIILLGNMNILKEIPDMDIETNINSLDLTELNTFTTAYAKFDFEKGKFDMASEIAMKDGEINGYIKPILKDVQIYSKKEKGSFRNKVWQAVVGITVEITENQKKDQTGTKLPFYGKYSDPDIGILYTLIGVLENMLIKAYEPKADDSIDYKNFNDKEGLKEKVKGIFKKDK